MAATRDTEYMRADTGDLYASSHEAAQIWLTGKIFVVCAGLIDPVNTAMTGQEWECPRPASE